jgi:hypothetical protein
MLKPQEEQDTRRWSVERKKKKFFIFQKDPGRAQLWRRERAPNQRTLGPGLIDRTSYICSYSSF